MMYILPGMGASSKMYTTSPEWNSLPETVFVDWPQYKGEKTLQEVATRLIDQYGIQSEDIIAGSSLGGMIAIEIAKLTDASKVILLGSAVNPAEINKLLLSLAPMAAVTPVKLIQLLSGKANSHLLEMFCETDDQFIKSMCLAIAEWKGAEDYQRIERIHGSKDLVISCPENAHVINGGGHLIAMTHPQDCVRIIKSI